MTTRITKAEIEAAAKAINREVGCYGGPTSAECVYIGSDNCDCARVARVVLEAARNATIITPMPRDCDAKEK